MSVAQAQARRAGGAADSDLARGSYGVSSDTTRAVRRGGEEGADRRDPPVNGRARVRAGPRVGRKLGWAEAILNGRHIVDSPNCYLSKELKQYSDN